MTTFTLPYQTRNPIANWLQRFLDSTSPEFRACLAAGCEMEFSHRIDENGHRITMTTRNPVAVVEQDGRIIVYEKKVL